MKKYLLIVLILLFSSEVFAEGYNVYSPKNFQFEERNEKLLFIMDFSNSMNEFIGNYKKVDLMVETMGKILPRISRNAEVGLRVYGHRGGITPYDACKATKLSVPIMVGSGVRIQKSLENTRPSGMTPITFSLKQAVSKDFFNYLGPKHIILLTDGGENCDESPCEYAIKLMQADKSFKIDVIAFNIQNEDDLDQLKCVATMTRGSFYTANTAGELVNSLTNSLEIKKNVEAKIIPH